MSLEQDTRNVMDHLYDARMIWLGLIGVDSPIFDRMAAERFGRED